MDNTGFKVMSDILVESFLVPFRLDHMLTKFLDKILVKSKSKEISQEISHKNSTTIKSINDIKQQPDTFKTP